jgi:hypothetical protein
VKKLIFEGTSSIDTSQGISDDGGVSTSTRGDDEQVPLDELPAEVSTHCYQEAAEILKLYALWQRCRHRGVFTETNDADPSSIFRMRSCLMRYLSEANHSQSAEVEPGITDRNIEAVP